MMKQVVLVAVLLLAIAGSEVQADPESLLAPVLVYAGKSYPSVKTPDFLSYDRVLRQYQAERIRRRFGAILDPGRYSCFDLLEVDALFRCKKPSESPDLFLKRFPKQR